MMARSVPFATSSWAGTVRRRCGGALWQNNVATALVIELVADCPVRGHNLAARNSRQAAHRVTSTTSSEIGGGTGSLWALRLSR